MAGGAQIPIPNKWAMLRNQEHIKTLLYNAAYRDRAGKTYHNEIFLHITERFLANRPLAIKYHSAFPAHLRWRDVLTVPHYIFNAVDYMVSATLTIMSDREINRNCSFFITLDNGS